MGYIFHITNRCGVLTYPPKHLRGIPNRSSLAPKPRIREPLPCSGVASKYPRAMGLDQLGQLRATVIRNQTFRSSPRATKPQNVTQQTHVCLESRLEGRTESGVELGGAGPKPLSVRQRKGDSHSESRLQVQEQSRIDVELGAGGSHRRIADVDRPTHATGDYLRTIRASRLSKNSQ